MKRMLGMIVMGNDGGIGNQSRRLCYMLGPERILYVDSTGFSKNKEQHQDWYDGFNGYITKGFPTDKEVDVFLKGLTHVYMIENPFNFRILSQSKKLGIKTYVAPNYEFCDNLDKPHLPIPDTFLMPSYWHIDTMQQKFGSNKVQYLPPPIDPSEFADARDYNLGNHGRNFLHTVGTLATHDRNGTLDLIQSLKYTNSQFSLTIHSQHELPPEYKTDDKRVTYHIGTVPNACDVYKGFDALILPRRYGGLCLPMNEALMSAMPVIMTDISPNNQVLPEQWLVTSNYKDVFYARVNIEVYQSNIKELAKKLDWLCSVDMEALKLDAFDIGMGFSFSSLRDKYNQLWQ